MTAIASRSTVVVEVGAVARAAVDEPWSLGDAVAALPHRPTVEYVRARALDGYQIVYVTARRERLREATEAWLREHVGVPWVELLMRPVGETLPALEVKAGLFHRRIRDHYHVAFAIDRLRRDVIAMWRSNGVHSLHVHTDLRYSASSDMVRSVAPSNTVDSALFDPAAEVDTRESLPLVRS